MVNPMEDDSEFEEQRTDLQELIREWGQVKKILDTETTSSAQQENLICFE